MFIENKKKLKKPSLKKKKNVYYQINKNAKYNYNFEIKTSRIYYIHQYFVEDSVKNKKHKSNSND